MTRMDRWRVGEACEARFQLECVKRGWEIAKPFGHLHHYDFVIRRDMQLPWETTQVKAASMDGSNKAKGYNERLVTPLRFSRSGRGHRYAEDAFDLLASVHLETDRVWLIPLRCLHKQRSSFAMRGADCFLLRDGVEPDFSDVETLTITFQAAVKVPKRDKLTPKDRKKIAARLAAGETRTALAQEFRVRRTTISAIANGGTHG